MIKEIAKESMNEILAKGFGILCLILFVLIVTLAYCHYKDRVDWELELAEKNSIVFALQEQAKEKDVYINELKEQIEWSNFLTLILDKDQRTRMDFLDDYISKNKNGLYKKTR